MFFRRLQPLKQNPYPGKICPDERNAPRKGGFPRLLRQTDNFPERETLFKCAGIYPEQLLPCAHLPGYGGPSDTYKAAAPKEGTLPDPADIFMKDNPADDAVSRKRVGCDPLHIIRQDHFARTCRPGHDQAAHNMKPILQPDT